MYNYPFTKIEEFDDIAIHTRYKIAKKEGKHEEFLRDCAFGTRDNARTAMQWNDSGNAGFTDAITDVLINPNHKRINVKKQQQEEASILNFYKRVILLRKSKEYKDVLIYGKFKMLFEESEKVLAYIREYDDKKILVIVNFFEEETTIDLSKYNFSRLIISNYQKPIKNSKIYTLRGFEAMAFELK